MLCGHKLGEHLLLLVEIEVQQGRARHDLLAAEVEAGYELSLAEGKLELVDVDVHLRHGTSTARSRAPVSSKASRTSLLNELYLW